MHQGRIDSIQSKKIFSSRFGWNVMRPLRTASIAGSASSSILQNHCSETIGSTRAPDRLAEPDRVVHAAPRRRSGPRAQLATARLVSLLERDPSHSGFRSRSRPCASMDS